MIINKVEICGVNTSELPVLKADQMRELLVKIKQGDQEAKIGRASCRERV